MDGLIPSFFIKILVKILKKSIILYIVRGVILKKDHLMSLKYLLILTVPIFIELLLQLVVGYSDQFMMKKYENAVNGITNANVINNMIINAFTVF